MAKTKQIRLRTLRRFSWIFGDFDEAGIEFEAKAHPRGRATAAEMAAHLVERGFAEYVDEAHSNQAEAD